MKNIITINPGLNHLPRGGFLIPTSSGYLQIGSPPETIKDTMMLPERVPAVFILPDEMFSIDKGISVAELEFPIYYNHFLCNKKTVIICNQEQKEQLEVVLKESVFGPEIVDLSAEYPEGVNHEGYPDIQKEMAFFRGNRKLEDLVEFKVFSDNVVRLNNIDVIRKEKIGFDIYDDGKLIAEVPLIIEYHVKYDVGQKLPEPFVAPEFGVTCLGPSHGFDPNDNTSGFIIWINGRGIMIDPPVNSTEWLRQSNVNPKIIDHIILTHTHADHDAGTFQKILEEFPVTIHTTVTVMDSFIRKYSAMTKLPRKQLFSLFNFHPVMIDKPMYIEGAQFIYHYTLHSIPTVGFRVHYLNQSFIYTSDHLNHPETLDKLNEANIFTESRYKFLKNFPWHYNIIYHEAGIPPLHTPVSYLSSLPVQVQKNITVYHIAKKDFPENTALRLARFGIENTLYPEIISHKYVDATRLLDILNHVDLFHDFSISKARDFLTIVKEESFKRGEYIIHKNTPGDKFYIILSGNVSIQGIDLDTKKSYGKYEYFGEVSVLTGEERSADVVADTDVIAVTMDRSAFLHFINGTTLENDLLRLINVRNSNSWNVLSKSKIFGSMTSHQITRLESVMRQIDVKEKSFNLLKKGEAMETAYILVQGEVELILGNDVMYVFQAGDFIGDIMGIQKHLPSSFDVIAKSGFQAYAISVSDLNNYLQQNPGIYMKLIRYHEEITNG